jgi:hypothetical protein
MFVNQKKPLHVSVLFIRPSSRDHMPWFLPLLYCLPLICVRWVFAWYVAVCVYHLFACVFGVSDSGKSSSVCVCAWCSCQWKVWFWTFHKQTFHSQEHQAHIKTDEIHIQPHTKQILNEYKSTENTIPTAQSTAYGRLSVVEWKDRNL